VIWPYHGCMSRNDTIFTTDDLEPGEEAQLASLAGDEDYWDYLDSLEIELGGVREWDSAVGGAS